MVHLADFIECELGGAPLTPLAVTGMGNPMPPMDGHDGSEPMVFNKKAVKDRKKHARNRKKMEKENIGTQGI